MHPQTVEVLLASFAQTVGLNASRRFFYKKLLRLPISASNVGLVGFWIEREFILLTRRKQRWRLFFTGSSCRQWRVLVCLKNSICFSWQRCREIFLAGHLRLKSCLRIWAFGIFGRTSRETWGPIKIGAVRNFEIEYLCQTEGCGWSVPHVELSHSYQRVSGKKCSYNQFGGAGKPWKA